MKQLSWEGFGGSNDLQFPLQARIVPLATGGRTSFEGRVGAVIEDVNELANAKKIIPLLSRGSAIQMLMAQRPPTRMMNKLPS